MNTQNNTGITPLYIVQLPHPPLNPPTPVLTRIQWWTSNTWGTGLMLVLGLISPHHQFQYLKIFLGGIVIIYKINKYIDELE